MTIRFTEGFGIYGTGNIATKLLDRWASRTGTGAINTGDGRHSGTTDYGIQFAALDDSLTANVTGIASGAIVTVGFAYRWDGVQRDMALLHLVDSVGSNKAFITAEGSGGYVTAGGNGNVINASTLGYFQSGVWGYYEIVLDCSANGTVKLRKNGVETHSVGHGWTTGFQITQLKIYGRHVTSGARFQDIYVADNAGSAPQNVPLGDVRIETLLPNANGANSQFTPGASNLLTYQQSTLEEAGVATGWVSFAASTTSVARATDYVIAGAASLKYNWSTGDGAVRTDSTFAVTAGLPYSVRLTQRCGATSFQCKVGIRWLDSGGSELSITYSGNTAIGVSNVELSLANAVAPTGAVSGQIVSYTTQSGGSDAWIDQIQVVQAASLPGFAAGGGNSSQVREVPHDGDTTYVQSDVAGHTDTYPHADLVTVSGTVLDVRPVLTFSRQAVGVRTVGAVASSTKVPSVRAVATAGSTSQMASLTINKPAGTVDGDLLIACVNRDGGASLTLPSGWTEVRTDGSTVQWQVVAWKVAGASEPASYVFTPSATGYLSGGILTLTGAATTSPVDVHSGNTNTLSGTSQTATGVTTTGADSLLIAFFGNNQGTGTSHWTPPSGWTEHFESGSQLSVAAMTKLQAVAGATGDVVATNNQSPGAVRSQLVAVKRGVSASDSTATVTPDDTIGVYKAKQVAFPTNPATSAAWTIAEVNAAEFGVKIVS